MPFEGPVMPKLIAIGLIVIIVGVVLIIVGVLSLIFRSHGKASYGGVVVIGPIPIVFGSDSNAVKIAVIGAIALMVLAVILMLLPALLLRHGVPPQT
jgi:uncharacterized membrane protein